MSFADAMSSIEDKAFAMSPDQFRARFKVGDWITGWATERAVQITAIGNIRFLFRDPKRPRQEFVHRISGHRWTKVGDVQMVERG